MSQYVFRVEGEQTWEATPPFRTPFVTAESDRHCYQVRTRHVATGAETVWPEACAAASPLPPLGELQLQGISKNGQGTWQRDLPDLQGLGPSLAWGPGGGLLVATAYYDVETHVSSGEVARFGY